MRYRINKKQYTKVTRTEKEANRRMDLIEERKALVQDRKRPIPEEVDVGEWFFTNGQAGFPVEQSEKAVGDIAGLIADYLGSRCLDIEAGQLSHLSYRSDRSQLAAFQKFCEKMRSTDLAMAVGADNLDAYRTQVMGRLAKRKIAAVSARHALGTVKALLRWAYRKEILDSLPRVIDKYASIVLPAPRPQFFRVDEVKLRWPRFHGHFNCLVSRLR
ncbi:hypothetical protein LCGC14_3093360, partial [marine sediment metagenome]